MELTDQQQREAVILLFLVAKAIENRKHFERVCGYPEEYGDDAKLLERIEQFLISKNISEFCKNVIQNAIKSIDNHAD